MQSITVRSHVGADGILHLELPIAAKEQELEVTVLYQPVQAESQPQSSEALKHSTKKRQPHPDIAGKMKITGDIFDSIPAADWNPSA
ncbi:MAG: hypothetical protein AAF716_18110 [Cyanobacteria bacterium P01_D01_bin.1]